MAITFALEFATANRVRYRCTRVAGGLTAAIIPNAGGATPDVTTDLEAAALANNDANGSFLALMTTSVADNAAAKAILESGTALRVRLTSITAAGTVWSYEGRAGSGGAGGPPTLLVAYGGAGADGDVTFVDIEFIHSMDR